MLWDTHMHTSFSGDSDAAPEDMIRQAMTLGLGGICITDHMDLDYPEEPDLFLLDLENYCPEIARLREAYREIFPIYCGIELGLQPQLAAKHRSITETNDFDFVIGSSHVVHGMDPYYPAYYEGRTEKEAYTEYFESILENIRYFDDFDVYGHIDYVVRYGPNRNVCYSYSLYRDVIDEILRQLVSRGKGIEINTAGFRYGLGHPNPTEEVIRRYHELGGEIITVGSDAHRPEDVGADFDKVCGILQDCGMKYFTIFQRRVPKFLRL